MGTFIEDVISAVYKDRHSVRANEESACQDLRTAVHALRVMTGLTAEQLAARLGMAMHRLSRLEKTGGPVMDQDFIRMIALAKEFSLFKLRGFFEKAQLLNWGKMKTSRGGKPRA
jgi:hypothetical protein